MHRRELLRGAAAAAAFGVVTQAGPAYAASGYGQTVSFSGHLWKIKVSSSKVGPGPNFFSDSPQNVWVDTLGRLHLKITNVNRRWYCAEVVCLDSPGFGTYTWQLASPVGTLD